MVGRWHLLEKMVPFWGDMLFFGRGIVIFAGAPKNRPVHFSYNISSFWRLPMIRFLSIAGLQDAGMDLDVRSAGATVTWVESQKSSGIWGKNHHENPTFPYEISTIKVYLGGGFKDFFIFTPYFGKWSNLTNIFQVGWNHQPVSLWNINYKCRYLNLQVNVEWIGYTWILLLMVQKFQGQPPRNGANPVND